MSLWGRLFGNRGGDPYAMGVAHYEAGRFTEAIAALRLAIAKGPHTTTGSLATFHLRQALVGEGKRLLGSGRPAEAIGFLTEVADGWSSFPDLQFLVGAALGLSRPQGHRADGLRGRRADRTKDPCVDSPYPA